MRSGALNAIRPCTSSPRAASTSSNLSAMGTGGRPARPPRPNPVPPPPVPPRPFSTGVGGGGGGGGGAGAGGAVPPEGGAAGDGGASRRPDARNSSNDAPMSTRSTNTTATSVRSPVVIRTGTVAAAHGWLQHSGNGAVDTYAPFALVCGRPGGSHEACADCARSGAHAGLERSRVHLVREGGRRRRRRREPQ